MQLDKKLEDTFRLQLPQKKALERLGLRTIRDLLYHFPNRYISTDEIKTIKSLKKGDSVIVFGKITKLKTSKGWHSKIPMASGTLEDETGKIKVVWFHQPYIAKTFKDDSLVKVTGKVGENKAGAYFSNPEIKYVSSDEIQSVQSLFNNARGTAEYFSVYPESRGITSRWFTHAIAKILNDEEFEKVQDTLPDTLLKKYNLPNLVTALRWIHAPVR